MRWHFFSWVCVRGIYSLHWKVEGEDLLHWKENEDSVLDKEDRPG
jgi:hypothetical protein